MGTGYHTGPHLYFIPQSKIEIYWSYEEEIFRISSQKRPAKKMVLISGPRQVGKTTLARTVITDEASYLN